jgi:hypothetical protein
MFASSVCLCASVPGPIADVLSCVLLFAVVGYPTEIISNRRYETRETDGDGPTFRVHGEFLEGKTRQMWTMCCTCTCVSMFYNIHVPACCKYMVLYHVPCVMCHVSCVMCHVSCVMCHVSCVMCCVMV